MRKDDVKKVKSSRTEVQGPKFKVRRPESRGKEPTGGMEPGKKESAPVAGTKAEIVALARHGGDRQGSRGALGDYRPMWP